MELLIQLFNSGSNSGIYYTLKCDKMSTMHQLK